MTILIASVKLVLQRGYLRKVCEWGYNQDCISDCSQVNLLTVCLEVRDFIFLGSLPWDPEALTTDWVKVVV